MSEKKSNLSRRDFITATAAGIVGAGLASMPGRKALAGEKKKTGGKFITRKLGRTGLELPIVSMGALNIDSPGILKAAYDKGVRHIDTASGYHAGRNEEIVGEIVKKEGIRKDLVIGTKIFVPNQRKGLDPEKVPAKMMKHTDDSLERLQMDYVDIMYVHVAKSAEEINDEAMIEGMKQIKKSGKARFIGVSTHENMTEVLNAVAAGGVYDVVLHTINFTLADDAEFMKAVRNAHGKGVGLIAMKTQAGGKLIKDDEEALKTYTGETIATAALKWVLAHEEITTAIPSYKTFEHMEQDVAVGYDLTLSSDEKKFLSEKLETLKTGMGFCRQCHICSSTCPGGADIASLMRTHMYAARYSDFHMARTMIDQIGKARGIAGCVACGSCSAICAHGVDIGRNIEDLKLIYA